MSDNTKYAIVRHGGKQYKVAAGTKLKIEKVNAKAGEAFEFSDVLSIVDGDKVSFSPGGKIKAKVLAAEVKDKKVIIFKKRRTKGYTKKQGHRQVRTEVLVEAI